MSDGGASLDTSGNQPDSVALSSYRTTQECSNHPLRISQGEREAESPETQFQCRNRMPNSPPLASRITVQPGGIWPCDTIDATG